MKQKGFSLIELLVVVAIIGILAAIGVVAYNGYTKTAKIKATTANHVTIVKFISAEIALCNSGAGYLKLKPKGGGGIEPPCYGFTAAEAVYVATTFSTHFEALKFQNPYGCNKSVNPSCIIIFVTSEECTGPQNINGIGCTKIEGKKNEAVTVTTCIEGLIDIYGSSYTGCEKTLTNTIVLE